MINLPIPHNVILITFGRKRALYLICSQYALTGAGAEVGTTTGSGVGAEAWAGAEAGTTTEIGAGAGAGAEAHMMIKN